METSSTTVFVPPSNVSTIIPSSIPPDSSSLTASDNPASSEGPSSSVDTTSFSSPTTMDSTAGGQSSSVESTQLSTAPPSITSEPSSTEDSSTPEPSQISTDNPSPTSEPSSTENPSPSDSSPDSTQTSTEDPTPSPTSTSGPSSTGAGENPSTSDSSPESTSADSEPPAPSTTGASPTSGDSTGSSETVTIASSPTQTENPAPPAETSTEAAPSSNSDAETDTAATPTSTDSPTTTASRPTDNSPTAAPSNSRSDSTPTDTSTNTLTDATPTNTITTPATITTVSSAPSTPSPGNSDSQVTSNTSIKSQSSPPVGSATTATSQSAAPSITSTTALPTQTTAQPVSTKAAQATASSVSSLLVSTSVTAPESLTTVSTDTPSSTILSGTLSSGSVPASFASVLSSAASQSLSIDLSSSLLSELSMEPTFSRPAIAAADVDATDESVAPGTTKTIGQSGSVATVVFMTTQFATTTEPDGVVTIIPTKTTVVTTTTNAGHLQPADPFTRNRGLIITGIILGTLIFVAGIVAIIWLCRRRQRRLRLRGEDPLITREEEDSRLGRVLIPGRPATGSGFGGLKKPKRRSPEPLASELDDPATAAGDREKNPGSGSDLEYPNDPNRVEHVVDEEDAYYMRPPLVLPVMAQEEYGSIMGTLHEFGWLPDRSTNGTAGAGAAGAALGRSRSIVSARDVFPDSASPESSITAVGKTSSEEDPFHDDNEVTPNQTRASSPSSGHRNTLSYYPVDQPSEPYSPWDREEHSHRRSTSTDALLVDEPPVERLRGGRSSTQDLPTTVSPASSLSLPHAVSTESLRPPTRPFSSAIANSSSSSASSLLNPPLRPQFLGRLSDLVRSEQPPMLPPIEPVASPAETDESYRADGLLDPALLSKKGSSSEGSAEQFSTNLSAESLFDHVDYTRPMSLIQFRRATSSTMNSGEPDVPQDITDNPEIDLTTSPVREYHNRLLGGHRLTPVASTSELNLNASTSRSPFGDEYGL